MRSLPLLVLFLAGILAMPAHAKTLTVFAAASTVQVVDAVRNEWNANQTPQFRVVYGSSGALARQLENGGPADIYFSANSTWVDYLVKNRIAINQTRQTLFRNRIVLVAPASDIILVTWNKFPCCHFNLNRTILSTTRDERKLYETPPRV